MKKKFKSAIKCLLMSICLTGVGASMFVSMGYADVGTIKSIEDNSYINDDVTWKYYNWAEKPDSNNTPGLENHRSRGYNPDTVTSSYADHATTEWQELGYQTGYGENVDDLGDYGVSWRTSGDGGTSWSDWGHDDLYVGQTAQFSFNMHSENVGNHYANILKGWIDWDTDNDATTYTFTESVAYGFKVLRDENGGNLVDYTTDQNDTTASTYTFDSGVSNWKINNRRNDYGYGNDDYTVLSEGILITSEYVGTAYLRARVTCSDSIAYVTEGANNYAWAHQWNYDSDDYMAAFNAYADYYQGEIEDWMFTVSETPPPSGAVPEPTTLALFGMGLIGLARVGRKKA